MDIAFSKEHEEYRQQVRNWLIENIPKSDNGEFSAEQNLDWERKLYEGGYSGISWPKEYGGQGNDIIFQTIFNEECAKLNAPSGMNLIGKQIFGPSLIELGTEEQKERFLPKIIRGEEMWCQCFSEPNAGSDLAALSTKAVLKGDKWVINGQKVWTSWAEHADYSILLARTDNEAPKHKGITFFIVPMSAEGITVRSLKQMSGEENDFAEVFFDDVIIDKDSVLGNINEGWQVTMRALSYERGGNSLGHAAHFSEELTELLELSERLETQVGEAITNSSYYRQKLAQSYIEVEVLRHMGLKIANKLINNQKVTTEASVQKLYWSEYHQRFGELAMEIQGLESPFWGEDGLNSGKFQQIFMRSRAETIFAGSSQIQRNIISERILGMPR
ncbi:hypothetical protein BTR23_09325 [Alkalihalophilus pseudofirmus]|nr:hypothetical protein BTR23_09325 [Alkalihalophilus pseudofirmus]